MGENRDVKNNNNNFRSLFHMKMEDIPKHSGVNTNSIIC